MYAFPTSLFKLIPKYFILFDAVVNGTVFLILLRLFIASVQKGFPGGSDGEECACNEGDPGLIPGLGRSPGGGHGNPLQYSGLGNPMDRGAWRATVHGVAESRT